MVGVARTGSLDGSTSVLRLTVTRSCPSAICSWEKLVHMYLHLTAGLGPVTPSQWYVCCRAQEYQNMSSFPLPISCFCLLRVALARPGRVGRETSADTPDRATPGFWEEHLPGEWHYQCTHLLSRNAFGGYGQLYSQSWLSQVSEEQEAEQLIGGLAVDP